MPELPEVETVANGVHARVAGQRIVRVWTSGKPQTFKSPESEIAETLTGKWIERVRRVGKSIVMDLREGPRKESDVGAQFLVHLGMTGRLLVSQPEVPLPPHTHAVLSLGDGREVRFVDPRRFGRFERCHAGRRLQRARAQNRRRSPPKNFQSSSGGASSRSRPHC